MAAIVALRAAMTDLGWSGRDVAAALGCHESEVRAVLAGDRPLVLGDLALLGDLGRAVLVRLLAEDRVAAHG